MKLTLVQMSVTSDKRENVQRAEREIRLAKQRGADMAILPEMFCCPYDNACFPRYAEPQGGETWRKLSQLAREQHIWLVGGTMPEQEGKKRYNTCYVFNREGQQVAKFRKMHLFDIHIDGGQHFMESETLSAGTEAVVFDTEYGRFGLAICFDLRFPALFGTLADLGAQAVIVPAAFNCTTGPLHWELLFRSRALDQQCYTIGVSSARDTTAQYVAYGHSIVCDPWGKVLAQAGSEACAMDVELVFSAVADVRRQIPLGR